MWWKKHKWPVIIAVVIIALLAGAFYYGGNSPSAKDWSVAANSVPTAQQGAEVTETLDPAETNGQGTKVDGEPAEKATLKGSASSGESPEQQTPSGEGTSGNETSVAEGKPLPLEPQNVQGSPSKYTCTISISCSTILANLELCNPEKVELVPKDGWILKPTLVALEAGESVFDVLQRTCKENRIHMEYMDTPIYNSAYIEGIHNLYEFDVGALSGWMYRVNGWFPNYGCSRYQVKDGDVIEWVYTCDLGNDVGGAYALGGQSQH